MGFPANRAMTERAERRAMIALLAAFALLVQAFVPAFAAAAPAAGGELLICTQMGLQAAPDDTGAPAPAADHTCKHCLCPSPALHATPSMGVARVAYAFAQRSPAPKAQHLSPPARAPPRPPGQGPPNTDA